MDCTKCEHYKTYSYGIAEGVQNIQGKCLYCKTLFPWLEESQFNEKEENE